MRSISKLIIIVFIAELMMFLIASGIPVNSPSLVSQYQSLESSITSQPYIDIAISIFSNNLKVSILDFIPVLGVFTLVISIVNTGMLLSAVSTAHNISGLLLALGLLTLPHSFLELPSYAIATSAGLYILLRRREWLRGVLTFLMVPVELFLAALVEASLFFVPNPYILWAAVAPILVGLYFFYEYLQKVADRHIKLPVNMAAASPVTPSFFSLDAQYFNQYRNDWAKATMYEAQGDFSTATNYLWSSIIDLIVAIAIKMTMPYYTKEDLDRVIQTLSFQNPQLNYLYQQAFTQKVQNNYQAFKVYAIQLASILQNIYQTSISRRIG